MAQKDAFKKLAERVQELTEHASAVAGRTIKSEREALKLGAEALAEVAGVKLEKLREYEAGTYSASAAMQLELLITIEVVKEILTTRPNANTASLKDFVFRAHFGDFPGYSRNKFEWKKTFEEMREKGEAASDCPPFLDLPLRSES